MTVRELVKFCYDRIVIYIATDDNMTDFVDLYFGDKYHIPEELLSYIVFNFGAKNNGLLEIQVTI